MYLTQTQGHKSHFEVNSHEKIIKMTQRDCSPIKGHMFQFQWHFIRLSTHLATVTDKVTKIIADLCTSVIAMKAEIGMGHRQR